MSQIEQNQQQAPTAMEAAVEFSMAWLSTQGDIGSLVQRTLLTALQEAQGLREVLQGQTQELDQTKKALSEYEKPQTGPTAKPRGITQQ